MPGKPTREEHPRGGSGPRAIAEAVARLTRKPLGRRGLVAAALVADWPAIVGGALAEWCEPERLALPPGKTGAESGGGTLHVVAVSGGLALELQHQAPRLIERVNAHFGYAAVARLAIRQGPLRQRRRPPLAPPPVLPAAAEAALAERLAGIEDEGLRRALQRLGRRLAAPSRPL